MTESLAAELRVLARKYETAAFLDGDPSRFMHSLRQGGDAREQETAAFLAACLSFGARAQLCAKIQAVMDAAAPSPYRWIAGGGYESFFAESDASFYRMFSQSDMRALCCRLRRLFAEHGTLGNAVRSAWQASATAGKELPLQDVIAVLFAGCRIVPQCAGSAKKKTCMFLRWMVRQDSPVDLGLWDWYPAARLCIPLDVHVLRQSQRLGLTARRSADARTAQEITEQLRLVWPDDPCRGDFALFGLGVNGGA